MHGGRAERGQAAASRRGGGARSRNRWVHTEGQCVHMPPSRCRGAALMMSSTRRIISAASVALSSAACLTLKASKMPSCSAEGGGVKRAGVRVVGAPGRDEGRQGSLVAPSLQHCSQHLRPRLQQHTTFKQTLDRPNPPSLQHVDARIQHNNGPFPAEETQAGAALSTLRRAPAACRPSRRSPRPRPRWCHRGSPSVRRASATQSPQSPGLSCVCVCGGGGGGVGGGGVGGWGGWVGGVGGGGGGRDKPLGVCWPGLGGGRDKPWGMRWAGLRHTLRRVQACLREGRRHRQQEESVGGRCDERSTCDEAAPCCCTAGCTKKRWGHHSTQHPPALSQMMVGIWRSARAKAAMARLRLPGVRSARSSTTRAICSSDQTMNESINIVT